MATNNLLTQPAPNYRRFVDNQVLTDNQLNEILDYLNHQDRLSRVMLHGVGIVCGLKISLDETSRQIHLSEGVAVTTAGDLLKSDPKNFTGFKKFEDSRVKYPVFTDDEGATINLWELETDTSPSDVNDLDQFESRSDISVSEAVAILYLEDCLADEEDCAPLDCDTYGLPVINQLRVLLVSPDDAKSIAEQDSVFSGLMQAGNEPFVQNLPQMYVPRVLLNAANTQSYAQFKRAYNVSFNVLADSISKLGAIAVFEKSFDEVGIDPVSELRNLSPPALNFQYVYDFYKDLATAYNELRGLLKKNYALCSPDPEAFPKHVLLGIPGSSIKTWRHPFYPSPTHVEAALNTMNTSFKKLLFMIRDFLISTKNEIRITPSRNYNFSLGKRVIPFYYDLEKSGDAAAFLKNWKESDIELVPNYYHFDYPGGEFNPLDVCLDDHDFYRIEGHTGKHVTDAHNKIQEIQKSKSLPFDIKQVAIGAYPDEATIDYEKYRVYFEDLQVILQAWNEEQQCLMKSASNFLTKFSTKQPGQHIGYMSTIESSSVDADGNTILGGTVLHRESSPFQPVFMASTAKTSKAKENQVIKNIAAEENTLGFVMKDVVSLTDNRNDIWVKTNNALINTISNWNADIVEAAINIPSQLIGYLKESEDHKLINIEDFTEENLEKYLKTLQAQCQKTKESKKKLQSLINKDDSVVRSQDWIENYLFILNRITSSCCLIEKVKVLYEQIIERKREVLDQFILDKFINEHPGAEHKAGVERGGTFILLYYSRLSAPSESSGNMSRAISSMAFESGSSFSMAQPYSGGDISGRETISADIREADILNRLRERPEIALTAAIPGGRRISGRENIPHGTVIGDLCLPYICCSGSPATTFIFPEQLATLRIPVDHVCVDEDGETDPIPLSVTPAGGTVKAFIQKRELGDVITENENGIFFDPSRVSADDFGTAIRFEVNGQPTEPILEVNQKPNASFKVARNIEFIRNNLVAVVKFQNTSTPFEELTFQWDFAGDLVTNQNALEFTHQFKVRPGENFDFEVTLTAFNGPCQASFSKSINIDAPELEEPDNPDEPDPEEPDNPDEPVRDCRDVTTRAIKASVNIIEREIREHGNNLDRRMVSIYQQQIRPMYERILGNPEEALSGRMDSNLFPFIQEMQTLLISAVAIQRTALQREFTLKLYYELALLYFYVQACRDNQISSEIASHGRRNNWLTFTEQAIEQFTEAMKMLLEADKIHAKLGSVQERMGSRFDNQMKNIVDKMISILTRFHG
ncbi:hypothetical protein BH23BAC3_BH23BAC3_07700 [soil metagenome]